MDVKRLLCSALCGACIVATFSDHSKKHSLDNIVGKEAAPEVILNEAEDKKVIMFGEVHAIVKYKYAYRTDILTTTYVPFPDDNFFVMDLLPDLKDMGYDYFALELAKDVQNASKVIKVVKSYSEGNVKRGDIEEHLLSTLETGAAGLLDLIDGARSLGMKIVFYDSLLPISNEREIEAFENLKEAIFDRDTDAKAVIFCGTYHTNEKPVRYAYGGEIKWLGSYLDDYFGEGSFSVSLSYNGFNADMVVPFLPEGVDE